mgnify:CR=1 FL=1|jgi:hypothetical protein
MIRYVFGIVSTQSDNAIKHAMTISDIAQSSLHKHTQHDHELGKHGAQHPYSLLDNSKE